MTDFLRNFLWQFYLHSELLPEICWEEVAEEILFVFFWCLAWGSNADFSSNKPTHYLLDHGDFKRHPETFNRLSDRASEQEQYRKESCNNSAVCKQYFTFISGEYLKAEYTYPNSFSTFWRKKQDCISYSAGNYYTIKRKEWFITQYGIHFNNEFYSAAIASSIIRVRSGSHTET